MAESEGLGAISEDIERVAEAIFEADRSSTWPDRPFSEADSLIRRNYERRAEAALTALSREQVSGEAEAWRQRVAEIITQELGAGAAVGLEGDEANRWLAEAIVSKLPLPADREQPEGAVPREEYIQAVERTNDVLRRGKTSREQPEDMGKRSPSSHPSWIRPWPDSTSREQPEGNPTHADEREAASQRIPPPPPEFLKSAGSGRPEASVPDPRSSPTPHGPEERYAEGQREEAECRHCGQPIWIVYHGPNANHTVKPRPLPAGGLSEEERRGIIDWLQEDAPRRIADVLARLASAPNQEGEQG